MPLAESWLTVLIHLVIVGIVIGLAIFDVVPRLTAPITPVIAGQLIVISMASITPHVSHSHAHEVSVLAVGSPTTEPGEASLLKVAHSWRSSHEVLLVMVAAVLGSILGVVVIAAMVV